MGKKTLGRQKIEMKKLEKDNNLQVTFSKRRHGVFKKASELQSLCGVDVCVVIFSPAKKCYSFGHPSVEAVAGRFLGQPPPSNQDESMNIDRDTKINELTNELYEVLEKLEEAKKRSEELKNTVLTEDARRFAKPLDEMDQGELEEMRVALEQLRTSVYIEREMLLARSTSDHPLSHLYAGSGSSGAGPSSPVMISDEPNLDHGNEVEPNHDKESRSS